MKTTNFTDCYFNKSAEAAKVANHNPRVIYQIFQKHNAILAGIELIYPLFDKCKDATIHSMMDGDTIAPWEPVMHIEAPLAEVVSLETVYLGILARCTRVATNVHACVKAANGKPLLFFPARFDVPEVQHYDGYAAHIGGAAGCSTYEQMTGFNGNATEPVGTMPHALIAAFNGDTAAASIAFAAARPKEKNWALVDFHNNCAKTAVEVYKALADKGLHLEGVRLDTSEKLIDDGIYDKFKPGVLGLYGVCVPLVEHVRQSLNEAGAKHVKICVSGGFNAPKITEFETAGAPVDVYAAGESTISGANPFTSDIVRVLNGLQWANVAKIGRGFKENPAMIRWTQIK